jgi:hypothetical protein
MPIVEKQVSANLQETPVRLQMLEGKDLNERLLDALTTGENRPELEELEYLRAGLSRWREQVATLRQRIHGLTAEPPERMQ